MESFLEISRKWNQTGTTISLYTSKENEEGKLMSVSLPLTEVKRLLKEKIGSITFVFTSAEFERRMDTAFQEILNEMGKDVGVHANKISISNNKG